MNQLIVNDITIEMTKDGVIWRNKVTKEEFSMLESDIIPVVNATVELYMAVLKSQENSLKSQK